MGVINKIELFKKLRDEIDRQLQLAVEAVQVTLDVATHEENKPENKYDTRGLEASYLARAQSERVLDLKDVKIAIESMKLRDFSKGQPIAISALIQLETNGKTLWVLLLPKGGGQSIQYQGIAIKVITPESPMGAQLVGKSVDDSIEIKDIEYDIVDVV